MNKVIFFILILFASSSLTFAQKVALWEQKINAQIEYQNRFAEILLKDAPDLKEIIVIGRDLQITMYEMKREKYLYLITRHPSRIDLDNDLNFEWADEDESSLIQASKYYASLKKKKEELKTKNQGHPMWPALREICNKVRESEKYRNVQNDLMEILQK